MKFLSFVLFLAVALGLFFFTRLGEVLSHQALRGYIARGGGWAYAAYVALFSLLVALGFPASILTVTGALVFGTWLNTGLTVAGATAGAAGSFIVARFLARDFIADLLDERGRNIDEWIARRGALAVLLLRLTPITPFNLVNFAAGLTAIRLTTYIWATAVGVAPGVFAYSYITTEAVKIDLAHPEQLLAPGPLAAFALIVFLTAIVPLIFRLLERHDRDSGR
ncbi:MAG: TVP38/TMEM64 family protein [Pseudomonadota bacterium]